MMSSFVTDALAVWVLLIAVFFPFAYGFLILWGSKYRFRCTTRNLMLATGVVALILGLSAAIISWLEQ